MVFVLYLALIVLSVSTLVLGYLWLSERSDAKRALRYTLDTVESLGRRVGAPELWAPLRGDQIGLLTQIDNMLTALRSRDEIEAEVLAAGDFPLAKLRMLHGEGHLHLEDGSGVNMLNELSQLLELDWRYLAIANRGRPVWSPEGAVRDVGVAMEGDGEFRIRATMETARDLGSFIRTLAPMRERQLPAGASPAVQFLETMVALLARATPPPSAPWELSEAWPPEDAKAAMAEIRALAVDAIYVLTGDVRIGEATLSSPDMETAFAERKIELLNDLLERLGAAEDPYSAWEGVDFLMNHLRSSARRFRFAKGMAEALANSPDDEQVDVTMMVRGRQGVVTFDDSKLTVLDLRLAAQHQLEAEECVAAWPAGAGPSL